MTDVVSRGSLDLGAVFAATGLALQRRPGSLTLLSIGFAVAVPMAIQFGLGGIGAMPETGAGLAFALSETIVASAVYSYGGMVMTWLALEALAGRSGALGAAFASAGRPWLTLLPLTLALSSGSLLRPILSALHYPLTLIGELSFLSTLATIVLTLFWGVAAPVAAAEGGGLLRILGRSSRLLGRGRWLFGLLYFGQLMLQGLATTLAFTLIGALGQTLAETQARIMMVRIGAMGLQAILFPLWRTFAVAYYRELCRLRDGAAPGEVAAIFE